jgi:DNA-binding PucR family transcriptional regulator
LPAAPTLRSAPGHVALRCSPLLLSEVVGIGSSNGSDVDAARTWVWGTLADLALDDESHARLRNTLQVFLHVGTYTATAERLTLHKNSVQYRIRKAEEALGARIEDRRADLELALRACQYLGQAVLRPVDSGSQLPS